jgi:hypothetical protein
MPVELPNVKNPLQADALTARARRGGRPFLFQITDPMRQPLYPYLLAAHVNPSDLTEGHTKSKNVVMTVGGFVEFNWPDELSTLSVTSSTGAFLGPDVGLTAGSDDTGGAFGRPSVARGGRGRHATMAWERQEDLLELFHNNGVIYNGQGQPVLRGRVMVIYDRGIYYGHFTHFEVKETDEKAFTFDLQWEFAVEESLYTFPGSTSRNVYPFSSKASGSAQQAEDDLVNGTGDFAPPAQSPVAPSATPSDNQINSTLFPGVGSPKDT